MPNSRGKRTERTEKIIAVSGGFDPLHVGHIRMLKEAAQLGRLVVILNNDNWLLAKKGFAFMPEEERKELIESLSFVYKVVLTEHAPHDPDRSVCRELQHIKPDIFANGGDRKTARDIPEAARCKKHGIKMIFNMGEGGKVQSSSWLTGAVKKNGSKAERPWGNFLLHQHDKDFWIKTIELKPGGETSVERHAERDEIWIGIRGIVTAIIGKMRYHITPGKVVRCRKGRLHCLSSKGGGVISEIALGQPKEDGIERPADNYGRN